MRTIRASEIGTYLYCKRAWWYQGQGMPSENQEQMESGQHFHALHGRQVLAAGFLRLAGWILLLLALTLGAILLTIEILNG